MLQIITPTSREELIKQKEALEYLLSQDTNEKDIEIHKQALKEIVKKLKEFNN